MNKKWLFGKVGLAVLALAVAGGGAWQWQRGNSNAAKNRYRTQAVEKGSLTQTVSANGTLNPVVLVNVGTQVSGTVKKLYADYNDHVKAGEVLLELDPALYAAQAAQSAANVANAQASLDLAIANEARSRSLYSQEYATRLELDQATQALKSARAQLALAQAQLQKDSTNLNYSKIRSPVAGVVVSREVDVGQTVAASFQTPTLFKIAQDLSKMQIDSSFAEADIGSIRVGQKVRFTVDAHPNQSFQGVVKQVRLNPTTQQNVVTYDVVVSVDNPRLILMPGMTAYVNIAVARRDDALLVPNAALRFKPSDSQAPSQEKRKAERKDGARATVYLLEQGKLRQVSLNIGITDNRVTEVLGGPLHAGDQVVVEDQKTEAPGAGQSGSAMRVRMF